MIQTAIRVLVIEDDEDDFILVSDVIEEIDTLNVSIERAASAELGRQALERNECDLCLLDYNLGATNGISLLREAHELGFEAPIIFLTGSRDKELDAMALEAGAVDYVFKGELEANRLSTAIRYALARRDTERERVERIKAEEANRAKSNFLAHLSHELRSPLAAIIGYTELLEKELETQPRILDYAHVVHRNSKHLLSLLNDILDLSKIEADKLEFDIRPISLFPFLTDIYLLVELAARDKSLHFSIDAPETLPTLIESDATRLRQVLLNLLMNAVKFTDEGKVSLKITLVPCDATENAFALQFTVTDSGVGIPKSELDTIFDPFYQAGHRRVGTGLGLTISREIVHRLGGDISVSSIVNVGSAFTVTLPIGSLEGVEQESWILSPGLESGQHESIPSLSGHVLIVDDLRDIRRLIGHFVESCGVSIQFAQNGLEALNILAQDGNRFDAVFMDIHMPVMGGVEAIQSLRASGFDKPVVALTAANMKGSKEDYLAAGFTHFLAKPVDRTALFKCLQHVLRAVMKESAADEVPDARFESSGEESVLVVDDALDAAEVMAEFVRMRGHDVHVAGSVAEARAFLRKHTPLIIFLDLNLPDGDGVALASEIRQGQAGTERQSKLIAVSGAELPEEDRPVFDAHLLKPVSLKSLHACL